MSRRQQSFLDPAYLAGAVWKARWLVLLMGILGAVAAAAFAMSQPKQYTATAQIVLDPRELNLVQNELTPTANGLNTDAALALVESQIAVMTSNSVLLRVVREADLTADPEFNGLRETWLGGISATLAALLSDDPAEAVDNRELRTVTNLWRHVSAVRNANSFVINVSVTSEDKEKAARLANLTTQIFIAEQGRAQSDLARRATAALSSRLAELRARVVEAEDAVETYKAENRLVGVGGRLIDDDYITRINNQLADVRAQITALNVRARSLREANVDDVAAGSFPEGLNSESLLRLRQVYSEATQNQAILASRLGPRHPQRMASDQAVATARQAIETELSRIVASAQTELARAQATERDLTSQIDTLRSRQIETSGAFVRLRELEREVDASRAVYEAYLLRARQTGEQESLNTTNVRVISDATVPFHPSSMSRRLVVVLGFFGGIALGILLALMGAVIRVARGTAAPAGAAVRPAFPASTSAARGQMPGMSPTAPVNRSQGDLSHDTAAPFTTASTSGVPGDTAIEEWASEARGTTTETQNDWLLAESVVPTAAHGRDWSLRGGSFDDAGQSVPSDDQDFVGAPSENAATGETAEGRRFQTPTEAAADGSEIVEGGAEPDVVATEATIATAEDVDAEKIEVASPELCESHDANETQIGKPVDHEMTDEVAEREASLETAGHRAVSDIESRREALRQRIRELGARRAVAPPVSPDLHAMADIEGGTIDERRERISLRLAAARHRRVDTGTEAAEPLGREAERG